MIEEAERAGANPVLVFYQPEMVAADARARELVERLRGKPELVSPVTAAVLKSLAATETPQGVVAVYAFPELIIPDPLLFALVLDAIRDPGNLGTILRTAWAAGTQAVFLARGTADPFNPKAVRAAMGAHFSVPIAQLAWDEIAQRINKISKIYLADTRGEITHAQADWSRPLVLIVGGEAQGASERAQQLATKRISIPMPGKAESLNAAVAAGILLFRAAE